MWRKVRGFGVGLAALVCTGGLATAADRADATAPAGKTVGSEIRLPSPVEASASVQAASSGLALPARRVAVSSRLSGVLMHLHVQEGQRVEVGQTLAELDHRAAQAAVEVARLRAKNDAPVRHAQHALEYASLQLKSVNKAHKAGAGSAHELRQAVLRHKQAKSAYEMGLNKQAIAVAALKFEEEKHAQHIIRAPFAGRTVQVFSQPGVMLRPSQPLLKMITLELLEATLHIPIDLFGKLRVGADYPLIAGEPVGRVLSGRLKTVDPVIDSARGTFRCVFTIDNRDEALPAGFVVTLDMEGVEETSESASVDAH